jgi:hypothetical protein
MSSKNKNIRYIRLAIFAVLLGGLNSNLGALGAFAASSPQPQEITGQNGDLFMEETTTPQTQKQRTSGRINVINGRDASTSDSTSAPRNPSRNSVFMQEVETPSAGKPRKAYVDLSNVGIQVDPSGNIIPTIDHSGGPVRPLGSNTQVYNEMPVPTITPTYDNPFALPYTMDGQPAAVGTAFVPMTPGSVPFLQPSFNPYNGRTTLNPYSARPYPLGFGGYGGYGGYPLYSGYPGNFYPGYPGGGGGGINIGKLHIGLGQPGFGYPGPGYGYPGSGLGYPRYGYGGYGAPGYGYPGYGYNGFRSPGFGRPLLGSGGPFGGGFGGGFGGLGGFSGPGGYRYNNGGGLIGNGIALPMPTKSTYTTSSSSSSLITPVLRDPATSTGDLLEDAKRSGLWSNTAGTGSGFSNTGLIGGSYGGSSEQHDTGVTQGSGLK